MGRQGNVFADCFKGVSRMMTVLVGNVARHAKIKVLTVIASHKHFLWKDCGTLVGSKYLELEGSGLPETQALQVRIDSVTIGLGLTSTWKAPGMSASFSVTIGLSAVTAANCFSEMGVF